MMIFGSKDKGSEEYELVDQDAELQDQHRHAQSSDEETSRRSSTDSQVSEIFERIEDRLGKDNIEREDFTDDSNFQLLRRGLEGDKRLKRYIFWCIGSFTLFIWLLGLLIYSRKSPGEFIASLQWQTNVEMSGQNVTLNNYVPTNQNITMDKLRRGIYLPSREDVVWLNKKQYPNGEGRGYYMSHKGRRSIVIRNVNSEYSQALVETPQITYNDRFYYLDDVILNPSFSFASSETKHIVKTDIDEQWRESTLALYWICSLPSLDCTPLQPPEKNNPANDPHNKEPQDLQKLNFAEFSPDGKWIVFSHANDLYLLEVTNGQVTSITEDGSDDIFNGVPDWIYEEEVIGSYKMIWWSPDTSKLIYAKLDDSEVSEYRLDYVVDSTNPSNLQQYPKNKKIKYPKPGTNNPKITILDYDLQKKSTSALDLKGTKSGSDLIVYQASWIDINNFLIKQTDRTSRVLSTLVYSKHDSQWSVDTVNSINVTEEYNGWVEKIPPPTVIPTEGDSDNMYIDRVVDNDRTHLALFKSARSKDYTLLTSSPDWDIRSDSPIVYDKLENRIYALTTAKSSMDSHLISIDINKPKNLVYLTSLEKEGKYEVGFSPDGQYLSLVYSGPNLPWQKLLDMQEAHDFLKGDGTGEKNGNIDELLEQKAPVNFVELTQKTFSETNLPTKIYKSIELTKKKNKKPIRLNVVEILPPNFDPKRGKYPILVNVYGGPGSQIVDKSFSVSFESVISAALDAIILIIDPRGTGEQSWSFKAFSRDQIGYWEPRDVSTVVSEYIAVNKKFVDKQRVAIWGWSYGGFSTLKTLEYDKGKTFKYGVAVAPVTNFMFYDSIYTERYMNSPSTNPNYKLTSQITDYENFKSIKRFFILHGTSDDNVHLQNSLWLLDKLDLNGVENYDIHIFPDNDHSISFHNADTIIYDKILGWLRNAFTGGFDDHYT